MSAKTFYAITMVVFSAVFVMHVLRLLNGWDIVIGGWSVPVWFSFVGAIATAFLAYTASSLRKKAKK